MTAIIGRNQNTAATATVPNGVTMTIGTTAETVIGVNLKRVRLAISVRGFDAFIRFIPASTDANTRKGEFITKDSPALILEGNDMFTGEISIINAQGAQTPTYFVQEL